MVGLRARVLVRSGLANAQGSHSLVRGLWCKHGGKVQVCWTATAVTRHRTGTLLLRVIAPPTRLSARAYFLIIHGTTKLPSLLQTLH